MKDKQTTREGSLNEVPDRPEDRARQNNALEPEQVAALAYNLWEARGCPVGSPEEDWFRAEQELASQTPELTTAR